jgi:hypothetical protein
MWKIIFIAILTINILESKSSPVWSQKLSTIREHYNKIMVPSGKEQLGPNEDLRIEDEDCLKENLRLKNPENEISKKFTQLDIIFIFDAVAGICNPNSVKETMRRLLGEKPYEKNIDANVDCYKNELYKMEPTTTILDGYTPNQETENSDVCKEKVGEINANIERSVEKFRKSSEYIQCINPMDPFNLKIVLLKMKIIMGVDITDEKVDEEVLKVIKHLNSEAILALNCIMHEVSKSD